MQVAGDACFQQHFIADDLQILGIEYVSADLIHAAGALAAGISGPQGVAGFQTVQHFLRQTADDLLLKIKVQQGVPDADQTGGGVAAEVALGFHDGNLCAHPGCADGSHDTGGAAADDDDIEFMVFSLCSTHMDTTSQSVSYQFHRTVGSGRCFSQCLRTYGLFRSRTDSRITSSGGMVTRTGLARGFSMRFTRIRLA